MRKRFNTDESIVVKGGRFKGETFRLEAEISELEGEPTDLPTLAAKGNWAARNALSIDEYKAEDAPFYYGKIGALGYIISKADLGI